MIKDFLKINYSRNNKKGQAIVEAIIIAPIILAMFFIMLQFFIFLDIKQKLIQSARYAGWDMISYSAPELEKVDRKQLKGLSKEAKKEKRKQLKKEARKKQRQEMEPKKNALIAIIAQILDHPPEDESKLRFTRFQSKTSDRLKDRKLKKQLRKAKLFYKVMGLGKDKDFWNVEISDSFKIRHMEMLQGLFKLASRKGKFVRVTRSTRYKERYAILAGDFWNSADKDEARDRIGKIWLFPVGYVLTIQKIENIIDKLAQFADWAPLKKPLCKINFDVVP